MQTETSKKLVIVLTQNSNNDKATVAFTIANVALSNGTQVGMFLSSNGVELGRDKACELTVVRPFRPLTALIEAFVENGGVLWTCAPCFKHRGLNVEEIVEGNLVTSAGPMLEWVTEGASTLCF
ncbi:MAG: DsrE family protein [Planctomycetota bacterium]|nr:DsrE family protein [Planctomycetota bacterium]